LPVIYTLGHSNHPFSYFKSLINEYGISLVCDVRSIPYSRHHPRFRKKNLEKSLLENGIGYLFLGKELGGKRDESGLKNGEGKINYDLVRQSALFQKGIKQIGDNLKEGEIPLLLCAEKDPLKCHRFFLISPMLVEKGWEVRHILASGEGISQTEGEKAYLKAIKGPTLFSGRAEALKKAYSQGSGTKK